MLRELGGHFAKMCAESPNGGKVIFNMEDPEVFKLLIDYAYTNDIPYVSVRANAHDKAQQLRHLVQFYALADKFVSPTRALSLSPCLHVFQILRGAT